MYLHILLINHRKRKNKLTYLDSDFTEMWKRDKLNVPE